MCDDDEEDIFTWIATKNGADLGFIDSIVSAAIKRSPAAIRLPLGTKGSRGFGLLHIETNENRMKSIKGLGFSTATEFVAEVAAEWDVILEGDNNRLVLAKEKSGYDLRLIVQEFVRGEKRYWSVSTGIVSRVVRGTILYKKIKTAG